MALDRLVSEEIQDLIPAGTSRIFAGKEAGRHHLRQDEINDLLLRLARSGRRVVRLKGGDPFIFGRGGEEAEHLARHHAPNTVRFITGRAKDDGDWPKLVDADRTLIYMGLGTPGRMAEALIAAGLPADALGSASREGQGKLVMKVSKFLTLNGMVVLTAPPDFTLAEAARRFAQSVGGRRFSLAVVTGHDDQLLGVISLGDIAHALGTHEEQAANMLVRDVMTTDVVICSPDDDLEDVLNRIADKGIRHVPVVERAKLAGLVVRRDALEFLYQQASLDVAHLTDWLFRSDARY